MRITEKLVLVSSLFVAGLSQAMFVPICQRTPAVARFLVQELAKTCESIEEKDLLAITRVVVDDGDVKEFKSGDFSGLTNLEILNIRSNRYTELPEDLLKDLVHLKTLVIISTTLRHYPDDFLAHNPEIENLHIFRNKVRSISESVFSRLAAARYLKVLDFDQALGEAERARLTTLFPKGGSVELNFY